MAPVALFAGSARDDTRAMETTTTTRLAGAYHKRLARFVSRERIGDWQLKLYALARPEQEVRAELIEATRRLAADTLPPVDERHHGAGFAIAHDAAFPIALIYWWEDVNEVHARIFAGTGDDPGDLTPAAPDALGCVWELGVVEFERRAWIDDVIGNPAGPDVEAYLTRRFDGLI
jgi:hypothetical protein